MKTEATAGEPPSAAQNNLENRDRAPLFAQYAVSQIFNVVPQTGIPPESDLPVILEIGEPEQSSFAGNVGTEPRLSANEVDRKFGSETEAALRVNEMPHLNNNAVPQTSNDAAPQTSGNVVPQTSNNAAPPTSGNEAPQKVKNEVPQVSTAAGSSPAERAVPLRQSDLAAAEKRLVKRKSGTSKKAIKKQTYSKSRKVVPIKIFVLPEEKTRLEAEAAESQQSLSNFIRRQIKLSENRTGRKKRLGLSTAELKDIGFD